MFAGALVGAPPRDAGTVLIFRAGGAMPSSGSISADSSSSSVSRATRFVAGVLRGWPGGSIPFAFAAAVATCRLGVTGGRGIIGRGGVVCMAISSPSAGGVAGVMSLGVTIGAGAIRALFSTSCFFSSSTAAHFTHSSCFRYIYCC